MNRRDVLALGLGLPSLLGGAMAPARTARAAEPVTLQFWEGHSAQEEAATLRMIAAFEAANPDIKIARTKVNFGADFERITMAAASSTLPDVSPIWSGFLTQFAGAGALLDLSKFGAAEVKGTVYPGSWTYGQWKDGTYGLPYAFDPRFLPYSRTALVEIGLETLPDTLDGLREALKRLTKRSGGDQVQRFGMACTGDDENMYLFVHLLMAHGGSVFTEDGRAVAIDGEAGQQAAAFLSTLVKDGTVAFGVQRDSMRQGLFDGRYAVIYDGPWIFYAQQRAGQEAFPLGVAPMPGPTRDRQVTVASVGDYVVYSQSKHPREAYRFVQYMASADAQQHRIATLKTAVTPAVFDQPVAKDTFAKWPALKESQDFLQNARILPQNERWGRLSQALIPAVQAITSGQDPREAIQAAARQANRSMRR